MTTRSLALLLAAAAAAAGCGQPYTPEPKAHLAGPQNPGGVFDEGHVQADYEMLTYDVLHSTLHDVLALGDDVAPDAMTVCTGDGVTVETSCPRANPIGYLEANADQLGAPEYGTENPQGTYGPRLLSTGGFKVWMLAASSACGRMMAEQEAPALFPGDVPGDAFIDDYDTAFLTLMGRLPTDAERTRLDQMQIATDTATGAMWFDSLPKRGAAVCTVLLGNLEFLGAN